METSKSTLKRQRTSERSRIKNKARKNEIATAEKSFRKAIATNDKSNTQDSLVKICSLLDKSAKVGIIHKNKASRKKAQLMALAKASEAKA